MYETPVFTPLGWQCPICRRVYSPTTFQCYYCGGITEMATNTTYQQKKEEFVRKIMVGDTPETMKTMTTGSEVK